MNGISTSLSSQQKTYLKRRGIQNSAPELGWTSAQFYDGSTGFCIPISDHEHRRDRFRAVMTTSDNTKTKWFGKKGTATPKIYMPPNLAQNIRERDGHLIIASGEIDLATFYEIGWRNVIAFTSEGSVPHNLAERLKALGVTYVHYWHDNDRAGRKSAEKVRDRLLNTGILYNAYTLEALVPERGDTNDLWQLLNFDREAFIQALESAPLSELAPAQTKSAKPQIDFERLNSDLLRDVTTRILNQPRARKSGDNIVCCSPLRHERNPSFSFSLTNGVWYDFGTSEGGNLRQLAEQLGMTPQTQNYHDAQAYLMREAVPEMRYNYDPCDLRLMRGDEVVNVRYAAQIPFTHRTIALKSALNTGKTQAIIEHIKHHQLERVLVVTHLKSLTANTTQRLQENGLDFTLYSQATDDELMQANRIVCTLNSLHRLASIEPFDLIVFDETTQGLTHLFGRTFKGDQFANANASLEALIKRAGQVIALDAHMTEYVVEWLDHLRGDIHRIENTYKHAWGTCYVHQYTSSLIAHLDHALATQKEPIVLTVDSRQQAETLAQRYRQNLGDTAVMLVHGHNNHEPHVRHFIQNINQEIEGYRLIITSPVIGTGVDIQAPLHAVFGIFSGCHLKPSDALQQIARYRNAQERRIALNHHRYDFETSITNLHEQAITRANATRQTLDITSTEPATTATKLWAKTQAHANHQKNVFWDYFCTLASSEGFQLQFDYADIESVKQSLKQERRNLIAYQDEQRLTLTGMTPTEFRQRQRDHLAKREDYFALDRWRIETTTGQHITEDLLQRYKTERERQALISFTDYHTGNHDAPRITDVLQLEAPLHQRQHSTIQHQIFEDCVQIIFGSLDNNHYQHAEEIETRAQDFLAKHSENIRRFIDERHDLSQKPIPIIRRILKRFGIRLETRTNNHVEAGEPRRLMYRICPVSVRQMRHDAESRIAFYAQLKSHTKRDTDKDYSRFLCDSIEQSFNTPDRRTKSPED